MQPNFQPSMFLYGLSIFLRHFSTDGNDEFKSQLLDLKKILYLKISYSEVEPDVA